MGEAVIYLRQEMVAIGSCCHCGTPMSCERSLNEALLKDHSRKFYCINGHGQVYAGETEAERLKKQVEAERTRREWAEKNAETARRAESIARGKLKAQSERVKNGVCPCCKRSFTNLRRHMGTKHPEWDVEAEPKSRKRAGETA